LKRSEAEQTLPAIECQLINNKKSDKMKAVKQFFRLIALFFYPYQIFFSASITCSLQLSPCSFSLAAFLSRFNHLQLAACRFFPL
jgi:hypothetical protein